MSNDAHYNIQNQPPLTPFEDFLIARGFKLVAACDPEAFELGEISFPRIKGSEDSVIRNDYVVRIWRKRNLTTVRPEGSVSSPESPYVDSNETSEPDEHLGENVGDMQSRVTLVNTEQVGKERSSVVPPPLPSRAPSATEPPDGKTIRSAPPEGVESIKSLAPPISTTTIPSSGVESSIAPNERLIRPPAGDTEHTEVHDDELTLE